MSNQFDVTEPLDPDEKTLTGRINSDLLFKEAIATLLKSKPEESED